MYCVMPYMCWYQILKKHDASHMFLKLEDATFPYVLFSTVLALDITNCP